MLAPIDVPDDLISVQIRAQVLSSKISEILINELQSIELSAGFDVLLYPQTGYLFIQDGYLRLIRQDRIIRFYTEGDIIEIFSHNSQLPFQITSEFLTRAMHISESVFSRFLLSDNSLYQLWNEYQKIQHQILVGICAEYVDSEEQVKVNIQNINSGSVILEEGKRYNEVYVLIDGSADAFVGGVKVGSIHPGEFFGEISFLTDTLCSATVIASCSCVIQVIDKDSFSRVIRSRPQTMYALGRTLAERLLRANQQTLKRDND